jgi:anti-sigma factor RsiW
MTSAECAALRGDLLDAARGRLSPETERQVEAHLESCAECRGLWQRERALDAALGRLPEHRAPPGLEARLRASVGAAPLMESTALRAVTADAAADAPVDPGVDPPVDPAVDPPVAPPFERRLARRRVRPVPSQKWAALLIALAVALGVGSALMLSEGGSDALVTEAVNDHLRVLYAAQPLEIQSGGIHQVKPWFAGRDDYEPRLGFEGDADYSLAGGSVGYFIDRKAAVFVFKHRLHVITLFEFRADGLPWRGGGSVALGSVSARLSQVRGFQVLTFRAGDLGYALVSDADARALEELGKRIASGL